MRDGTGAGLSLGAGFLFFALAMGACDGVESSRSLLVARQPGWQRALSTLEQQQAALSSRFSASSNGIAPTQGTATQVRAVLEGTRQSLVDLDSRISQSTARFDRTVASGVAPAKAAEQESALIDGYLQTMSVQLASEGRTLDALAVNGPENARR